jgi:hypothetical protein
MGKLSEKVRKAIKRVHEDLSYPYYGEEKGLNLNKYWAMKGVAAMVANDDDCTLYELQVVHRIALYYFYRRGEK